MKKIYLVFIMVFFGGQLMAQSSTSTTRERQTNSSSSSTIGSSTTETNTTAVDGKQIELAGFPVYIHTGNKELDDANYLITKKKWIKEKKEMYDASIGKKNTSIPLGRNPARKKENSTIEKSTDELNNK